LPEWLYEQGIGETRCVLVDGGDIVEARIRLDGAVPAGSAIAARLTSSGRGGRNAIARGESGSEYLLPEGAPGISEGAPIVIEVTREAIPGNEPWKRPLARIAGRSAHEAAAPAGRALPFPASEDQLGSVGWDELIEQARSGFVPFADGALRITATPAMTLIDVDGNLDLDALAVRGAAESAMAIRRLDIGGSIGIDLPTIRGKGERQAAAAAIDAHLPPPFERTIVNGFGFVQVVRRRTRASLIELAQDRAVFEARALLRRAAFEPPGAKRLIAHPAVIAALGAGAEWIVSLGRQLGGPISLRAEPTLAMSGGYAEND
jgi:ribonuclease G